MIVIITYKITMWSIVFIHKYRCFYTSFTHLLSTIRHTTDVRKIRLVTSKDGKLHKGLNKVIFMKR